MRERFLSEIKSFVRSCGREQELRISGKIPDYDKYIELRLGTGAVYTLCALAE